MSAYILEFDVEHYFDPGTWDKMTPREQAERRAQLHAVLTRRRGNAGVTPRQQDFLQSIPAGGNRGNIGTEKTIGKAKAQGDNPQRLSGSEL